MIKGRQLRRLPPPRALGRSLFLGRLRPRLPQPLPRLLPLLEALSPARVTSMHTTMAAKMENLSLKGLGTTVALLQLIMLLLPVG